MDEHASIHPSDPCQALTVSCAALAVTMGVFPSAFFQNGHAYFMQRLHAHPQVLPYAIHATYTGAGTDGTRQVRRHVDRQSLKAKEGESEGCSLEQMMRTCFALHSIAVTPGRQEEPLQARGLVAPGGQGLQAGEVSDLQPIATG